MWSVQLAHMPPKVAVAIAISPRVDLVVLFLEGGKTPVAKRDWQNASGKTRVAKKPHFNFDTPLWTF